MESVKERKPSVKRRFPKTFTYSRMYIKTQIQKRICILYVCTRIAYRNNVRAIRYFYIVFVFVCDKNKALSKQQLAFRCVEMRWNKFSLIYIYICISDRYVCIFAGRVSISQCIMSQWTNTYWRTRRIEFLSWFSPHAMAHTTQSVVCARRVNIDCRFKTFSLCCI